MMLVVPLTNVLIYLTCRSTISVSYTNVSDTRGGLYDVLAIFRLAYFPQMHIVSGLDMMLLAIIQVLTHYLGVLLGKVDIL